MPDAIQRLLGHVTIAPLPDVPFARPNITSAEYTVTLSAVQNGVPNNVTTKVREDFINAFGESTVESQVGGTFTTTQEIRTRESLFRPGQAYGKDWSRQPRVPDTPSPYDAATFIPMIDDIIDHPLREAMKPTSSKSRRSMASRSDADLRHRPGQGSGHRSRNLRQSSLVVRRLRMPRP